MLLSRYAECSYWLGRYMERIESLSRLLMVTESFAADQDGEDAWAPILNVFADQDVFAERKKPLSISIANIKVEGHIFISLSALNQHQKSLALAGSRYPLYSSYARDAGCFFGPGQNARFDRWVWYPPGGRRGDL